MASFERPAELGAMFDAPKPSVFDASSRAPALVVMMRMTCLKSAFLPLLSVRVAWSITWRRMLKTSGCAFSISSRRRTAYGVFRTASVRSPPWSKPT